MDTTGAAPAVSERALGAVLGACAVGLAGAVVIGFFPIGPVSGHMATHIALMNIAAPLAAVVLGRHREAPGSAGGLSVLWLATGGQLAVLWFSHSPILHHAMQSHFAAAAAVHSVLFIAALVFWVSIVNSVRWRWHAILALLISGKLACLLGALLVFSPRLIYGAHAPLASDVAALADQHLAGLLMVIACPLSFVLTAIVLAAQVLSDVSTSGSAVPLDRNPIGQ